MQINYFTASGMLFSWAVPPQLHCKCSTDVGSQYSEIWPHLGMTMAKGWARTVFPVRRDAWMSQLLLPDSRSPSPTWQSPGAGGGVWDEWEPPLPASIPEGSSCAAAAVHLHGLCLGTCRVKAVLFPAEMHSYISAHARSVFIPKGQQVLLGNFQH